MFHEVPEGDIFKDAAGNKVLVGAMGVDKWKEVDGALVRQLRFIVIMTAINKFPRKLDGDSDTLSQASMLN